jgi:hypothetical protein
VLWDILSDIMVAVSFAMTRQQAAKDWTPINEASNPDWSDRYGQGRENIYISAMA